MQGIVTGPMAVTRLGITLDIAPYGADTMIITVLMLLSCSCASLQASLATDGIEVSDRPYTGSTWSLPVIAYKCKYADADKAQGADMCWRLQRRCMVHVGAGSHGSRSLQSSYFGLQESQPDRSCQCAHQVSCPSG